MGNLDLARKGTSSSFHEQVVIVILDKGFYIEIISTSNANSRSPWLIIRTNLHFVSSKEERKGCEPVGNFDLTRKGTMLSFYEKDDITVF